MLRSKEVKCMSKARILVGLIYIFSGMEGSRPILMGAASSAEIAPHRHSCKAWLWGFR